MSKPDPADRDKILDLEVSRGFMTRTAVGITAIPLGLISSLTLTPHSRTILAIGCPLLFVATVLWLVFAGRVRERATVQIERMNAELRRAAEGGSDGH